MERTLVWEPWVPGHSGPPGSYYGFLPRPPGDPQHGHLALVGQVVRYSSDLDPWWAAFVVFDRVDDVRYPTAEDAIEAVEGSVECASMVAKIRRRRR